MRGMPPPSGKHILLLLIVYAKSQKMRMGICGNSKILNFLVLIVNFLLKFTGGCAIIETTQQGLQ